MPGHVLLLCCLPALRKFCGLFRTEELTCHIEDVTLFVLDMVLDMLSEVSEKPSAAFNRLKRLAIS